MADTDTQHASAPAGGQVIEVSGNTAQPRSAVPQFALDAAGRQTERLSGILTGAAQSIDDLVAQVDLPLPEGVSGFVSNASQRLRALAERTNEEEAHKLLENLQRSAAANPLATAGIGAAIGAALGLALSQLGRVSRPTTEG